MRGSRSSAWASRSARPGSPGSRTRGARGAVGCRWMAGCVIDSATMADKRSTRGDAMRQAVDEAFSAAAGQAQVTRERAQDLVDELSGAAGRLRDVLEDLRPAAGDDVRALRDEVTALRREVQAMGERIGKLESARARPAAKKR